MDLLAQSAPVVETSLSFLLHLGGELAFPRGGERGAANALLHLPRGKGEELRQKLGVERPIAAGEWNYITVGEDGATPSARRLGETPKELEWRREFILLVVREDLCAAIAARPSAGGGALWSASISLSPADVASAASLIAGSIGESLPDLKYAAGAMGAEANLSRRNNDGVASGRLIGPVVAELHSDLEKRQRRSDRELRWFKTITRIQDAIGWELDGHKLNAAAARALKTNAGYDYLELVWLQPAGRSFEPVETFQRNDTSSGGPLLTMILKPEAQAELLRGHKPVVVDQESSKSVLMNHRLLELMDLRSGLLLPLIYQRHPNGLLKLFSRKADHYSDADAERWESIGRVLAKSLANARVHSAMRRMATVDGLTNVYNHRFFAEQVAREFKRSNRYAGSLTLLMIDIDFFKNYNDTYGHLQGDRVLAMVAGVIKNNVREVDIACRYGGEEFAVILPETDVEQGRVVAEKIRRAVEETPVRQGLRQTGTKVTISIGVAAVNSETQAPSELVNHADMALYRAKKLGRNRCEVF